MVTITSTSAAVQYLQTNGVSDNTRIVSDMARDELCPSSGRKEMVNTAGVQLARQVAIQMDIDVRLSCDVCNPTFFRCLTSFSRATIGRILFESVGLSLASVQRRRIANVLCYLRTKSWQGLLVISNCVSKITLQCVTPLRPRP